MNIRKIIGSNLESLEAWCPRDDTRIPQNRLYRMSWKLRKETGFSHLFADGIPHFVEIYQPSRRKGIVPCLEERYQSLSLAPAEIVINNEMWETDLRRLFYNAVRESAQRRGPGQVYLPPDRRKIFFPEPPFKSSKNYLDGLELSLLRVNKSDMALLVDYFREKKEDYSGRLPKPPKSGERHDFIERLLEQIIPQQGLPIFIGGNKLTISGQSISLKLTNGEKS